MSSILRNFFRKILYLFSFKPFSRNDLYKITYLQKGCQAILQTFLPEYISFLTDNERCPTALRQLAYDINIAK